MGTPKRVCQEPEITQLASTACPTCGYEAPEEDAAAQANAIRGGLDICLNCGEIMAFEPTPKPLRLGGPAIEAVPARAKDFVRLGYEGHLKLLGVQSLTHRAAQLRGYHLGKLRFRGGRA